MDDARWQRLKKATWFMKEQEEVTAYVEELRGLIADGDDSMVECPDCGKREAVRTIEEITEHLGGPEDGGIFDFDYTFKAPVFTCPCGYAWTGHEREVASTEARRLEVEKRYRDKVLEERRRDAATAESIERMRTYFADGMGFKEPVGGVEAMMLSLAAEASAQRKAHHNAKDEANKLGHQYGELLKETADLRRFKAAVDEALNSGDGTYRP